MTAHLTASSHKSHTRCLQQSHLLYGVRGRIDGLVRKFVSLYTMHIPPNIAASSMR